VIAGSVESGGDISVSLNDGSEYSAKVVGRDSSYDLAVLKITGATRKGVIELVSGTSRGIRLKSDALRSINESRFKQFSSPLAGFAQLALPLIGRVAAGSPILAQEHVDKTYYVENSLFQRQPDYLLKVRGMSMRDAGIMDGDLLAVQSTKDAKNGQIIVARLGDEVTVKRFRRNKDVIELHPENPDYQTIIVEPGEAFEIEGLAVGLIRNTMLM
jgi:repressor LexA